MVAWKNMDTLNSFKEMSESKRVNLVEAMSGENGAKRAKEYSVPMAAGLVFLISFLLLLMRQSL